MENMTVMTGDVLDLNAYKTYGEYKAALDGELQRSAESFVRIGYLLKVARDTDILAESGYRSVNEFAEKEYNLDKSQVSRFIRINDEFSGNGYSDCLQERYRSFGYAKLAMMLLLPTEINEELSGNYSKADIQAIREEVDEEKKTSDLEVMLEEKDEGQQGSSAFGKFIYQLGRDNPEMYLGMYEAVFHTVYDGSINGVVEKLMDVLAPAGEAIISVRIAGEGRKMLSIKGTDADPVLVDVRSGEKQSSTWTELVNELNFLYPDPENARRSFEMRYGEPFPEKKAEVAPVQPQKEQASRKVSKVTKAKKPEKTRAEAVSDEAGNVPGQQEKEEQEAAGGENEEGREDATQGETCADGEQTEEPAADPESADEEDGTVGGAGEDSTGGGTDSESGAGVAPVQPEGEQLEGKMDISDSPEYLPKNAEKTGTETESAEAAGDEGSEAAIRDADGLEQYIENQAKIIIEDLQTMRVRCIQHNWDSLIERAHKVIERAEAVRNMEEMWHG